MQTGFTEEELAGQPDAWRRAAALAPNVPLPRTGERVAVIGCGTSWFMGQAYASLREGAGLGETDAFTASEFPQGRPYDRILAITRSGTTTEVVDALRSVRGRVPTIAITADPKTPVMEAADETVVLDFADERSVVQTRFATSTLTLFRAHLGEDVTGSIADAEAALEQSLPDGATTRRQFTFLGTGWTIGLANEAALKMREAAIAWTESYPAMDYRHGPISITDEASVVWFLGVPPQGLVEEVRALGAITVTEPDRDPLAELVRIQRLAVRIGRNKGQNPDEPRHLTRSVVLTGEQS